MFSKKRREAVARIDEANNAREKQADKLVQSALDAVDENLALKREVREKAARFIGSLRPTNRPYSSSRSGLKLVPD